MSTDVRRGFFGTIFHLLGIVFHPLFWAIGSFHNHWLAYMYGHVRRNEKRVYRVQFLWYRDAIYLHPMVWGSLVLAACQRANLVSPGWLLLAWFVTLAVAMITILHDLSIERTAVVVICAIALAGGAYFSTMEYHWNPFNAVARHLRGFNAGVTPGFYMISAYVFGMVVLYTWAEAVLFHRIELDASYVIEHKFAKKTTRIPIFASGVSRHVPDLLEAASMGAADIEVRTAQQGMLIFTNVPGASWWLAGAIDDMLDVKSDEEIDVKHREEHARPADAHQVQVLEHDNDAVQGDGLHHHVVHNAADVAGHGDHRAPQVHHN